MSSQGSWALLRVLADGAFHSGASLGAQFNMTRAGVHHHISLLRRMGVPVAGVPHKGYHVPGGISLLDEAGLRAALPNLDVYYHESLPSTQDQLLPLARQKPARPILCVTEYQLKGRGRGNKSWHAPLGGALCFSLCVVLNQPMQSLRGFTLALGVALREALASLGAMGLQLKWPNDIYHQSGAKLSGILTEAFGDIEGPTAVVIGVGLNVRVPHEGLCVLDKPWTDLQTCFSSNMPSRQSLLIELVQAILFACDCYQREGFAPFLPLYDQHDYLKGKTVKVLHQDKEIITKVKGVSETGELWIEEPPFKLVSASVMGSH